MAHALYQSLATRSHTGEPMPFREGCEWALNVFSPGVHYDRPKDDRFNRRVRVGLDMLNHAGLHARPVETLSGQRLRHQAMLDDLDSHSLVARTSSHRLVRAMILTGLDLKKFDGSHVEGLMYAELERQRFARRTALTRDEADNALSLLAEQVHHVAKPTHTEILCTLFRECGVDGMAQARQPVTPVLDRALSR